MGLRSEQQVDAGLQTLGISQLRCLVVKRKHAFGHRQGFGFARISQHRVKSG
jgi:hypothetical protein